MKVVLVSLRAVLVKLLAVVGGDDDHRLLPKTGFPEGAEEGREVEGVDAAVDLADTQLILGGIAMARTGGATPSLRGRGMAVTGLSLGIASVVLMVGMAVPALILLPALEKAREIANQRVCAANLKQVGTALYTYGYDHTGDFPPQLGLLVLEGSISASTLTCPSSDTLMPSVRAVDDAAEWADAHVDYVYIWTRMGLGVEPSAVIAYERFGNHGDDGINILFGDMHVDWYTYDRAEQLLTEQGIDPEYANF